MSTNNQPGIHKQVICANCFIRKGGKYLVLRRSEHKKYAPGFVHPVGGKVNLGENPYSAAIREVYEETGVRVANMRLEAVFLELKPVLDEPYDWLIFHFSADYKASKVKTTEEGELLWLTDEEFQREKLIPSLKPVIKHILSKQTGTLFATFEYDSQKQRIVKQTLDFCKIN